MLSRGPHPCGWTEYYDRCFLYVAKSTAWHEAEVILWRLLQHLVYFVCVDFDTYLPWCIPSTLVTFVHSILFISNVEKLSVHECKPCICA